MTEVCSGKRHDRIDAMTPPARGVSTFFLIINRMLSVLSFKLRRLLFVTAAAFPTLSACKTTPKTMTLDVVCFNYLERPIFEIFIDNKAGDSSDPYPATGGSTISGVRLALGPKRVTWRLDGPEGSSRLGETVVARNMPVLANVPPDAEFLAIHIYPDDTVELIASRHYPRATEKGKTMASGARPD